MSKTVTKLDEDTIVIEDSYVHMDFDDDTLSIFVAVDNEDFTVPLEWLQEMVEHEKTRSMELRLKFSLSKDLVKNAIRNWMLGRTDTFLEEDKPMFDALRAELNKCISMLDNMKFVPDRYLKLNDLRESVDGVKDIIGDDAVKAIMKIIDARK